MSIDITRNVLDASARSVAILNERIAELVIHLIEHIILRINNKLNVISINIHLYIKYLELKKRMQIS